MIKSLYMLASNRAMYEISDGIGEWTGGKWPGTFYFNRPETFNVTESPNDYWHYGPTHIMTLKHEIGIWRASIRSGSRKLPEVPMSSAPFAREGDEVLNNTCRLFSWGIVREPITGRPTAMRRPVDVYVKRLSCRDDLCKFTRSWEHRGFKLCGTFSDLGAPIYCNEAEGAARVHYILQDARTNSDEGRAGCSYEFDALDVSKFTDSIDRQLGSWIEHGSTPADRPPYTRPGVTHDND